MIPSTFSLALLLSFNVSTGVLRLFGSSSGFCGSGSLSLSGGWIVVVSCLLDCGAQINKLALGLRDTGNGGL